MRKQSILVSVLAGLTAIAGCGSTTRTRELSSGYAIFDIKAGPEVRAARIVDAIKAGLQKGTTQEQIVSSIPPSPLPETATSTEIVSSRSVPVRVRRSPDSSTRTPDRTGNEVPRPAAARPAVPRASTRTSRSHRNFTP